MTHLFVFVNRPSTCQTALTVPTRLGRSSTRRRSCFMSEAFHRATLCCPSWWTGAQRNSHFSNWSPVVCLAGVERKRGIQGFFRRNCKKNSRALFDVSQLRFYLCACVQGFFFSSSKWGWIRVFPTSSALNAFIRRLQHPSVWNETQPPLRPEKHNWRSFSLFSASCQTSP